MWANSINSPKSTRDSTEFSNQSGSTYNFRQSEQFSPDRNYQEAINSSDAYRTLFLGDLSYFCTEEDLCNLFTSYGQISTVRVRRGVTGESLMHGFIALESHEAAKRAITELDGQIFMGRCMR